MAQPPKTITFPNTFPADFAYRAGAAVFCLPGVIGIGLAISRHNLKFGLDLALPLLFFFCALLLALTFELTVDEAGLHQRSILGRREVSWSEVRRVDFSRTYSIHGEGLRELVWLSMVSTAAQKAIADEAIRLANLRPTREKIVFPMRGQWVR